MKIRSHSESHIVERDDGSRWQIFPGDLDLTLNWKPETDLVIVTVEDEVSSHALVGGGAEVRVIAAGELAGARGEVGLEGRAENCGPSPLRHANSKGRGFSPQPHPLTRDALPARSDANAVAHAARAYADADTRPAVVVAAVIVSAAFDVALARACESASTNRCAAPDWAIAVYRASGSTVPSFWLPRTTILHVGNRPKHSHFHVRAEAPPMSNERNNHRTSVLLFAVAVIIAILAAFVTRRQRVDTRTGLAKPHAPLQRAPVEH